MSYSTGQVRVLKAFCFAFPKRSLNVPQAFQFKVERKREHIQLIIFRNAFLLTLSRVPKTTFVLVGKMGKLSLYARQRIVNLHQLKKNHFQIANEIREGDNINVSILVLSLFLSDVFIKQGISMTN